MQHQKVRLNRKRYSQRELQNSIRAEIRARFADSDFSLEGQKVMSIQRKTKSALRSSNFRLEASFATPSLQ